MRDYGIPKLLTWRWTPCAALVLGALSFVGFALLAAALDRAPTIAKPAIAAPNPTPMRHRRIAPRHDHAAVCMLLLFVAKGDGSAFPHGPVAKNRRK